MKVGKSTFGSRLPRALFCAFEQGVNALAGVKAVPLLKWSEFKRVLSQLRKPEAREMYDSIVIDTASVAWTLCEKYICQREGVDSIRDVAWGQGWGMLKNEFQEAFREITMLGYGILFIAHAKEKPTELRDQEGNAISAMAPDLPAAAYTIVNSIVDIIAYIAKEAQPDGSIERWLYTRETPTVFAGSRYQYLKGRIKFGYDELVNAIGDAIDKSVELDGAEVSDGEEVRVESQKTFVEVMEEAKTLWITYLDQSLPDEIRETRRNQFDDVIFKVFGKTMKLSQALPSQQDLVEIAIDEMQTIVDQNR